jgi:Mg-chelatase subunit ChlD
VTRVLLAALLYLWAGVAVADDVDVAIVFVVDVSESMTPREVDMARSAHAEAIASPEVQHAIASTETGRIAVAYVEFATQARTAVEWQMLVGGDLSGSIAFGSAVMDASRDGLGANTGLGTGLLEADRLFDALPFTAGRLVVDVTGDGRSNMGVPIGLGREALLSRGVTINAMPMIGASSEPDIAAYYAGEVVGGWGAFSIPITGVSDMPQALRSKIVLEMF